jgi:uncharacterized phage-associated protein
MYDPRALANFILDAADRQGLVITHMALHKIMFFAHGWSLAERGEPLLAATFEAWQHGPVLPIVYRQFSKCGRQPIRDRATRIDLATGRDLRFDAVLAAEDAAFVERVTELLGPVSALVLSDMSHEPGGPWDMVWNGKQRVNPGMVIPHALIAEHFRERAAARKGRHVH